MELSCWLDKEDAMWKQRSRISWLQAKDRNTRFFHSKAMNCFEKSLIVGLMDGNGVWQEDMVDVEQIILDYYSDLFTSSGLTNFAELVDAVEPKVTQEMYSNLIMQFHANEVKKALTQMFPHKAPDLDPDLGSMPLLFYQHFWLTVGDVVTKRY